MIVDCAIYEEGRRRAGMVELEHAYQERRHDGNFVWIGLHEPSAEEFDSLKREFDLHPLAVEDAINAHQRPKLEVYRDMVFLVLKTARYVDPEEVIELGELLVFLGHDFVITVRHGEGSALKQVREDLERDQSKLSCGPGAVLHAILDRVVDDYVPAIDGLETDIDEVEAELFSGERSNPAERVYRLQREVLEFRRATAPLVDPLDRLAAGHYAQVHP
ncbi:MAG TPA: magnesium and cobalt transport protein CorA, partial [Thermoleophilaceae bacterium]|nr:magnesium and cobalt transport protein CorA [Thermoleophilaceae bacterium]